MIKNNIKNKFFGLMIILSGASMYGMLPEFNYEDGFDAIMPAVNQSDFYAFSNHPQGLPPVQVFEEKQEEEEEQEVVDAGTIRKASGKKCSIPGCGKEFAWPYLLRDHMRKHTQTGLYECEICHKKFTEKNNLKRHRNIHMAEPYECEKCGKKLYNKRGIGRHMLIHTGEKRHVCIVCKRRFPRSNDVTLHMRTHTGEKPYSCKVCKQQFSQNSNMNRHIRRVHNAAVVQS